VSPESESQEPFTIDGFDHARGDPKCGQCWTLFPEPCKCGGLIHGQFGDEDADCDYWLYYACDKCGSTDRPEGE